MNRTTNMMERMQIVELAAAGLSDGEIGRRMGWSKAVVRKWRRAGQRGGRGQLASQRGRRRGGAMSSFAATVSEAIAGWRQRHPGWGPKTLAAELARDPRFAQARRPSAATIARYLHEAGLSRSYEAHSLLPTPQGATVSAAHEVWEMDARGEESVAGVGKVALIDLNDRYTHLRLLSYPCWLGDQRVERHADTADYQTALRLAFVEWGLPQRLQVDHDSVFFDNRSRSPFPTRLHLWLVALGVPLTFVRPARPTDQGMTEHSHQLWQAQCLQGQHYASWEALYLSLHARRDFLNRHLPCAALADQPPLVAFPSAIHSGRHYRPEWERALLAMPLIHALLAQGRWFRLTSKDGTFALGGHVYYIGLPFAGESLEIHFDPDDQQLCVYSLTGLLLKRCPIQGLDADSLCGPLLDQLALPYFQLALPFDWQSLAAVRFFETLRGTN